MKHLSSLFQFILGFFLGLIILAGGTAAVAYVFLAKMSANPPKPLFAEEKPEKTATAQKNNPVGAIAPVKPLEKAEAPTPEPSPEPKKEEPLPPGTYKARVTWADGLSLRSEPSREAERIGGVGYNAELIVLQESDDKQWQKVRLSGGSQEGWIKAGNIEKVESQE